MDEGGWNLFKEHIGYTDEELKLFRERVKDEELSRAMEITGKTIIAEVVESHGCNSRHLKGDRFFLDGAGNLLSKLCPKRMCIYLMGALETAVFGVQELFYAGADPNNVQFKRFGCRDVGVKCGGWGRVVMEIKMVDRTK
ncbi:MAG: hypothetical protein JW807_08055 [Spirochaetes bacterium]|nr:hypothetical protein [Spirochaetota bacterium]